MSSRRRRPRPVFRIKQLYYVLCVRPWRCMGVVLASLRPSRPRLVQTQLEAFA